MESEGTFENDSVTSLIFQNSLEFLCPPLLTGPRPNLASPACTEDCQPCPQTCPSVSGVEAVTVLWQDRSIFLHNRVNFNRRDHVKTLSNGGSREEIKESCRRRE